MSEQEIPTYQPPENSPPNAVQWGIAEVFIGIFLSFFFGLIAVLIFKGVASSPDRLTLPGVFSAVVGGWIAYAGTAYVITRNLPGGWKEQLGFHFRLRDDIWKGVLGGIAGQVLVALIYLPLHFFAPGVVDDLDSPAKSLTDTMHGWRWGVFILFVGVISPVCEELFFRGITLRAFSRRWGPAAGIICSSVIFGIIHFEYLQTVALVAFGALLAWRATKTGRIGETIIAHGTFNVITVFALMFGVS